MGIFRSPKVMSMKNYNHIITKILSVFCSNKGLWVFLYLLSFFSLIDIPGSPVFKLPVYLQILYLIFVSAFKSSVLLLLLSALLSTKRLRIFAWIFLGLYSLIATANIFCYCYYGMGISRKLILILAQTTPDEIAGFMPGLSHNIIGIFKRPQFYLTVAGLSLLFFTLSKLNNRAFTYFCTITGIIGFGCFIMFSLAYTSGRSAHLLSARILKYGAEVYSWNKRYHEILAQKTPLPFVNSVESNHSANTVIVVIGESALRKHHSLYGYSLPTTPRINAMSDSLFIFNDAIGSSKSTSGNMERILSFKKDDQTFGDGLDYPLLIDFFNEAGYKTFWLSNQERTGSVSNTSGVMVMNSHVIEYVGADNSEDALCVRYDEVLIPELDKALSDTAGNKLIFLHLLGSHVEFKHRYPSELNVFSYNDELKAFEEYTWLDKDMAQRRAEYDNSIRYTDSLLSEIINKTARQKYPSLLVYFSDHGENVYDESSYTGRDDQSVEIPFIVYLNRCYRHQHPNIRQQILNAVNKPLSSANLIHMLLTLTGSKYELYDPELDVLSDSFKIRPRYVDEEIWPGDL